MARRTNQLNVERLEGRELMAGDVLVTPISAGLFINEARFQSGQDNLVLVTRLPSGLVRVAGLTDAIGDRTLVNGRPFQDFIVAPNTQFLGSLGAGNDTLQIVGARFNIINVDLGLAGATDTDVVNISGGTRTLGEVRIATGGGADTVFIQNTQVGDGIALLSENLIIDTGAGADTVNLAGGVRTTANVTIRTREGTDTVLVRGTTVGDGKGVTTEDLFIDTAAGADAVFFGQSGESVLVRGNLNVNTAFGTEAEVDTVRMLQTTALKSLAVQTGAGNDQVALGLVTAGTFLALSTGDGNDQATLLEVRSGDLFAVGMGAGDDALNLTGVGARRLTADGGPGTDRLETVLLDPIPTADFINWEVINGVTVPNSPGGVTPPGDTLP